MTDPVRAAMYGRVSTDDQVDGTSLDTQRDRCRSYIDVNGWTLVGEFVDEGVSGAKASRPRLDAVMSEARAGNVDVIVVMKLDRFGRSNRHLANALGDLDEWGVRLVSISEAFDTSSASGRMQRNMLGVFAEFEREQIRERTMSGLRAIASDGYWPGGPPPYGFRIVEDGRHKRLAVHDVEALMLRTAVSLLVDEGCSTLEAAERLNAMGMRPRRAARWTHHNLRRVLLDASLDGSWTYARQRRRKQARASAPVVVEIPPIVTAEQSQALHKVLSSTSTQRRRNSYYLLSRGMLVGACGATFHGVHRQDRLLRQYRCNNARSRLHPNGCACRRLSADDVEFVVWESVCELLGDPDALEAMAQDYLGMCADRTPIEEDRLADVELRIAASEAALAHQVADYIKAGVDARAVKAATETITSELDALRRHRATVLRWREQGVAEEARIEALRSLAANARARLSTMTDGERRQVLELLEIRVTVTGWSRCSVCDGGGKVKGGTGGLPCPACRMTRFIPQLRLEGRMFDRVLDAAQSLSTDDEFAVASNMSDVRWPFTRNVAIA